MKKTFLMAALAGALALPAAAQTPSSAAPKAHKPAMTADKSAQSSTAVSAADKAFVREAAIFVRNGAKPAAVCCLPLPCQVHRPIRGTAISPMRKSDRGMV